MSIKTASSESILAPKTFLAYKITVLIWSPLLRSGGPGSTHEAGLMSQRQNLNRMDLCSRSLKPLPEAAASTNRSFSPESAEAPSNYHIYTFHPLVAC